jgi:hypothetical protein
LGGLEAFEVLPCGKKGVCVCVYVCVCVFLGKNNGIKNNKNKKKKTQIFEGFFLFLVMGFLK